eukprot:2316995-Rhodomonas_salina.1
MVPRVVLISWTVERAVFFHGLQDKRCCVSWTAGAEVRCFMDCRCADVLFHEMELLSSVSVLRLEANDIKPKHLSDWLSQ